jgi:hypothetical protein
VVTLVLDIREQFPFSAADLAPLTQNDINRIATVLTPLALQASASLASIAATCDDQLGLHPGMSLSVVRHLLANRKWRVDMDKPIRPSEKLILLAIDSVESFQEIGGGVG